MASFINENWKQPKDDELFHNGIEFNSKIYTNDVTMMTIIRVYYVFFKILNIMSKYYWEIDHCSPVNKHDYGEIWGFRRRKVFAIVCQVSNIKVSAMAR